MSKPKRNPHNPLTLERQERVKDALWELLKDDPELGRAEPSSKEVSG